MIKGEMTFKFEKGINLRMIKILDDEVNCGIVLFGSMQHEGKIVPVLVMHENLVDKEAFADEFYKLIEKHGVQLHPK